MRKLLLPIHFLLIVAVSTPAFALTRFVQDNPFFRRTALSGNVGAGIPVGEFSSSRPGDGNHDLGAVDWSADLEHYFGRNISLGLTVSGSTYEDKNGGILDVDGNLRFGETSISTFGGFLRYVAVNQTPIHPFLRLGVGSVAVQFQDPQERFRSNRAGTLHAGAGLFAILSDYVALNGQIMYNQGFTENAYIPDNDTRVGFDIKYWAFTGGVSIFFP